MVRVASRAFGDLQLDAAEGGEQTQDADISYLHESADRRGVIGVTAVRDATAGVRANAGSKDELLGLNIGQKAEDTPSGWFALGQFDRKEQGADLAAESVPTSAHLRDTRESPYYLLGGNLQSNDNQRTLVLATYERPTDQTCDPSTGISIDTHFTGEHAELRHDIYWRGNLLSIGGGLGDRNLASETFIPSPAPLIIPDFVQTQPQQVKWWQAYLHDSWQVSNGFRVIGELCADRLTSVLTTSTLSPPLSPSLTRVGSNSGLPSLTLAWQPSGRDGLYLRARGVDGSIDDYQLLKPQEVFLFPTSDLPTLLLGARGQSYEAEYDHTFANSSFFRLGYLQQDLRETEDADEEFLTHSIYRAVETSYECLLTPSLTGFTNLFYIDSAGIVQLNGKLLPESEISDIPNFKGEIGLQYLNAKGWFAQPTYGYIGQRWQAYSETPGQPRAQNAGYGVVNLRVGKRWGLHTAIFVEVDNIGNQRYTLLSQSSELLQPGRLFRVGLSQRF